MDKNSPKYSTLQIDNQFYQPSEQILTLIFNQPISSSKIEELKFILQEDLIETRVKPTIAKINPDNRTMTVKFNFTQTLSNNILKITTNDPTLITSTDKEKCFIKYPISQSISHLDSNLDKEIELILKVVKWVILVSILIGLPFISEGAVKMIRMLQILEYFSPIKVDVPSNVEVFTEYFQAQDILSYLPNIFYSKLTSRECRLHPKLEINEFECLILNNIGHLIIPISLIFILKIVLSSIQILIRILNKQKDSHLMTSMGTIIDYLNNKYSPAFIMSLLLAIQPDLFLGITSIFKNKIEMTFQYIGSVFIFLIIISAYLIIVSRLIVFIYQNNSQNKINGSAHSSYTRAFPDLRMDKNQGIFYIIFLIISHTLISLSLVLLVNNPVLQILLFFVLTLLEIFFILILNPFKLRRSFIIGLLLLALYTVAQIGLLILEIFKSKISIEYKYYLIGMIIIGSLGLANIIMFSTYIFEIVETMYTLFRFKGDNKKIENGGLPKVNKTRNLSRLSKVPRKISPLQNISDRKKIKNKKGFSLYLHNNVKMKIGSTRRMFTKKKKGFYQLSYLKKSMKK